MPRIGSGAITITEVTDGTNASTTVTYDHAIATSHAVAQDTGEYRFRTTGNTRSANGLLNISTAGEFSINSIGTDGTDNSSLFEAIPSGQTCTFIPSTGTTSAFTMDEQFFRVGYRTYYFDLENQSPFPNSDGGDWAIHTSATITDPDSVNSTANWTTSISTLFLGTIGAASNVSGQPNNSDFFGTLAAGDTCRFRCTATAANGIANFTLDSAPVRVNADSGVVVASGSENNRDVWLFRITTTSISGDLTGIPGGFAAGTEFFDWSRTPAGSTPMYAALVTPTVDGANFLSSDGLDATFKWDTATTGTAGAAGDDGDDGATGARGPVIGFYAPYLTANSCTVADNNPVGIDLTSATIQTNLDRSASCANFGDTTTVPVDNDFGVFFNNGDPSQKLIVVHNGTDWVAGTRVIDGSLLVTGSITASEIATNAVTANKVDVDGDVHINAPSGSATSSGLSIGPLNTYPDIVNTARPETSGAFLGLDTRDTNANTQGKFFVGNKSQFIDWNGSQLRIGGNILTSGNIVSIDGSQVTRSTYILDGRNSGPDDSARVNAFIPQSSINDAANGLTYDELNTGSFGITSGGSLAAGQWGITTNVLSSTGLDDFDSGVGVLWLDNIDANGVDRSAEIAALDSDSTITFSTTESGKTGTVSMSVNSVTNINTRYFISISNVTGSIQDLSTTNGVLVSFGLNSLVIDVDTGSSTIFETVVPTGSRGRTLTPIVQNGNTLVGSANRTVEFAFIGVNQQMYGRGYSSSQMYNPANGSTFTFGYNDREESNSPANGNGLAPGQWEIRLNNGTTTPESTFDPSGSSRDNELVLIFSRFDRDGVDRTGELSTINDNDVITFSNSAGTLVIELTVTSTPSGNTSIPTTPADTLDTSGQLLSGSFIFFIDNINVTTGSQGDAVSANDNVNVTFATTQDDDDVYRQTTLLESDWTVINPTVVIDDGPEVISFRVTPLGDAEINNLHFTAAAGNIEETVRVTTVGGALDGTSSRGFGITQPFDKIENVTITPISTANIITSGALDVNNVAGTELTADFNDWRIFSYGLYLVNPPAPFVNGGQTFGIPDPTVPPDNRMGLKGGILMVKVEGY